MPDVNLSAQKIEELQQQHRVLDEALKQLQEIGCLTPSEELKARRLKKLKLQTKDLMLAMIVVGA